MRADALDRNLRAAKVPGMATQLKATSDHVDPLDGMGLLCRLEHNPEFFAAEFAKRLRRLIPQARLERAPLPG